MAAVWPLIKGDGDYLSFDTTIIQGILELPHNTQFKTRNFLKLQVDRLVPYDLTGSVALQYPSRCSRPDICKNRGVFPLFKPVR